MYKILTLQGLFRNFDDAFLPLFRPHLERLVADTKHDTHECSHRCAAEIISGVIRGSKHWTYEKVTLGCVPFDGNVENNYRTHTKYGEVNVFRGVCHSVHGVGEGASRMHPPPPLQHECTPLLQHRCTLPPPLDAPLPPRCSMDAPRLPSHSHCRKQTVNRRAVHILLECILVMMGFMKRYITKQLIELIVC